MGIEHAYKWQSTTQVEQQTKEKVKVVRKTSWITKGEKLLYTIASIGLVTSAIYIVSYSSSVDSLNRDVHSLETTIQQQEVTNNGLISQKKELSNPKRITEIARKHGLTIENANVKQATRFND